MTAPQEPERTWTDAEFNALARECRRLEADREYNAQLVQERDAKLAALTHAIEALRGEMLEPTATHGADTVMGMYAAGASAATQHWEARLAAILNSTKQEM